MEIDYKNSSGIIVNLEQMLSLVNEKNYKKIIRAIGLSAEIFFPSNYKENSVAVEEADQEFSKYLCEKIKRLYSSYLRKNYTSSDFKNWLIEIHSMEEETYDGDSKLNNNLELHHIEWLWRDILHCTGRVGKNLPSFHCEIFTCSKQAPNYLKGVIYFVFNEDECYIKKTSVKGRNLEKLIGDLEVTAWTDTSY